MFIGRKEELDCIKTRLDGNGYELGIIYGQRRIGKTSIILEAIKDYNHLYFLARDASYRNNLDYFSAQYRKYLKTPFTPFLIRLMHSLIQFWNRLLSKKQSLLLMNFPF